MLSPLIPDRLKPRAGRQSIWHASAQLLPLPPVRSLVDSVASRLARTSADDLTAANCSLGIWRFAHFQPFRIGVPIRSCLTPKISAHLLHAPADTAQTAARSRRSPELRCHCRRISQSQSLTLEVEPQTVRSAHRRRIFGRRLACGLPLVLIFSLPRRSPKKSPVRRVPT